MNAVPQIASSGRYNIEAMTLKDKLQPPGTDPEAIVKSNIGICGNHAALFLELMKLMNIKARPVQFYYTSNGKSYSHIAAEVFINGQWRYFDTTWAAFFLKNPSDPFSFASAEELLNGTVTKRFANSSQGWAYYRHTRNVDVFDYLSAKPSVVYGYDKGTVKISYVPGTPVSFDNIPNILGDSEDDGPFEGIKYNFGNLPGLYTIKLNIRNVVCKDKAAHLCVDNTCEPLAMP